MQNKIMYLEGLRGLACISVIFAHMEFFWGCITSNSGLYSQSSQIYKLLHFCDGGFGVSVFFILSGFVLTLSVRKYTINHSLFSMQGINQVTRI